MDYFNQGRATRYLGAGIILTFIILLIFTWPWFRQKLSDSRITNQPIQLVPERTPTEIISSYQAEVTQVASVLESPTAKISEISETLTKFFFSVRVPDTARNVHLKAALEFTNTNSQKTDSEKIIIWKEIIKKLQASTAKL